jgi:hypothetical protein
MVCAVRDECPSTTGFDASLLLPWLAGLEMDGEVRSGEVRGSVAADVTPAVVDVDVADSEDEP